MTHQSPYRPNHDVTQTYNSGFVEIFKASDGNLGTGLLPVEELTQKGHFHYEERKLGVQRYYDALQNQILIQRVIRIPKSSIPITTQDIAKTEDGNQYRIDLIQAVASYPPSLDLTLVAYEQGEAHTADVEEDFDYGE